MLAPPWLLPSLAPPNTIVLTISPYPLILPALPCLEVGLSAAWTSRPSAALRLSTPSALSGSASSPLAPWLHLGCLSHLSRPQPPGLSVLPGPICSQSSPWAPPPSIILLEWTSLHHGSSLPRLLCGPSSWLHSGFPPDSSWLIQVALMYIISIKSTLLKSMLKYSSFHMENSVIYSSI